MQYKPRPSKGAVQRPRAHRKLDFSDDTTERAEPSRAPAHAVADEEDRTGVRRTLFPDPGHGSVAYTIRNGAVDPDSVVARPSANGKWPRYDLIDNGSEAMQPLLGDDDRDAMLDAEASTRAPYGRGLAL